MRILGIVSASKLPEQRICVTAAEFQFANRKTRVTLSDIAASRINFEIFSKIKRCKSHFHVCCCIWDRIMNKNNARDLNIVHNPSLINFLKLHLFRILGENMAASFITDICLPMQHFGACWYLVAKSRKDGWMPFAFGFAFGGEIVKWLSLF